MSCGASSTFWSATCSSAGSGSSSFAGRPMRWCSDSAFSRWRSWPPAPSVGSTGGSVEGEIVVETVSKRRRRAEPTRRLRSGCRQVDAVVSLPRQQQIVRGGGDDRAGDDGGAGLDVVAAVRIGRREHLPEQIGQDTAQGGAQDGASV